MTKTEIIEFQTRTTIKLGRITIIKQCMWIYTHNYGTTLHRVELNITELSSPCKKKLENQQNELTTFYEYIESCHSKLWRLKKVINNYRFESKIT